MQFRKEERGREGLKGGVEEGGIEESREERFFLY